MTRTGASFTLLWSHLASLSGYAKFVTALIHYIASVADRTNRPCHRPYCADHSFSVDEGHRLSRQAEKRLFCLPGHPGRVPPAAATWYPLSVISGWGQKLGQGSCVARPLCSIHSEGRSCDFAHTLLTQLLLTQYFSSQESLDFGASRCSLCHKGDFILFKSCFLVLQPSESENPFVCSAIVSDIREQDSWTWTIPFKLQLTQCQSSLCLALLWHSLFQVDNESIFWSCRDFAFTWMWVLWIAWKIYKYGRRDARRRCSSRET